MSTALDLSGATRQAVQEFVDSSYGFGGIVGVPEDHFAKPSEMSADRSIHRVGEALDIRWVCRPSGFLGRGRCGAWGMRRDPSAMASGCFELTIVKGTCQFVGEHLVGLLHFLRSHRRSTMVGVRSEHSGPPGRLDLGSRRGRGDSENLVQRRWFVHQTGSARDSRSRHRVDDAQTSMDLRASRAEREGEPTFEAPSPRSAA